MVGWESMVAAAKEEVMAVTAERDQARSERDRAIVDGRGWKQRAEAAERAVDVHALQVAQQQIEGLTTERDRAQVEADGRYKDWAKAVDACDLLRKENSSLREQLGKLSAQKSKIQSERNEYASTITALSKENERLQVKLAKAEADAEHHKAHADKLWEAAHKELSYEPENNTRIVSIEDWQQMADQLEDAEDRLEKALEELKAEKRVCLEIAEENDLLSLELETKRIAFLQMVVSMGKVSEELLKK